MKLYVTVEEFLYAKKIENQTERTLRGYKNALNLFANWLQKEWTIDELEKIRVIHLKQYVAYHLKMGHKATYVNGIIKILRAFFKYTNGEDYTDIAYEKVAWVREEKPVIKAFSAQDARQLLEYYDNKSYLSCRNRTIITMFLETGIRCKELIDIDTLVRGASNGIPGGMEQKCTTVTFRIFPEEEIGLCPKWQKQPHRLRHRFNDRSGILLLLLCRLWSVLSRFHPEMGGFRVFFWKTGC